MKEPGGYIRRGQHHSPWEDAGAVIVFLRWPERGRVKSRLARLLPEETVVDLYRCFVEDVLEAVDRAGYPVIACYHPASSGNAVRDWLGESRSFLPQESGDLGNKMVGAFRSVFAGSANPLQKAVLLGSDLPDLPVAYVNEAMTALDTHDAVLGPAADGGYYLIGFRADTFTVEAFRGITWSAGDVLENTRERLQTCGKHPYMLPVWHDIDELDDLRHVLRTSGGGVRTARRTIDLLQSRNLKI